jgi:hypothetical protein
MTKRVATKTGYVSLNGDLVAKRLHITVADELVDELDQRLGPRERSRYIGVALRRALDDEWRWDDISAAIGVIDGDHEWDDDPAEWVRQQRTTDVRRVD